MGYDTKLVFVTCNGKRKDGRIVGYCSEVASIELACAAYDDFGELIEKKRRENDKVEKGVKTALEELEEKHKGLYTHEGEHTEEVMRMSKTAQDKLTKAYYKLKKEVERELPYFYPDGNTEAYRDSYGDLLLVGSLEEVNEAILKSNAKSIAKGDYPNGYRRFNAALKLMEGLKDFGEDIYVIMFGH